MLLESDDGRELVDDEAGTADERTVLRWAGEVRGYRLSVDSPRTTFVGADAAETLYVTTASLVEPDQRLHIDMGGGDDRVDVTVTVRREDAEVVRDFSHALDAADRLSRTGRLLVGPAPLALSDVRRAYLRRMLAQLGS